MASSSLRICAFGVLLLVQGSQGGFHQRQLLKDLMEDYTPLERPVGDDAQPITIHFTLSLMQIMDVDEKNQVLTTNVWLQMYWYDHYLRWNESEYPGVKTLRFTPDSVWKPDILLYNSANEEFDSTFHTHVLVNSSGYCQWLPPGILKSTCRIDVRWFPFDTQKCDLKFGSWTYDGWLLDLRMMESDTSGYVANGEWDLVGVPGTQNKVFYECCREPYLDVTFAVTMRRRTLYYALNMLVPCLLLSAMTFLVFLLPADSGEKISLGITVLLSLTVFMLLVAEVMPATSDSIPLIGQYFVMTMTMVALSVVATVFVLQYHHHDPDGGCMPRWDEQHKPTTTQHRQPMRQEEKKTIQTSKTQHRQGNHIDTYRENNSPQQYGNHSGLKVTEEIQVFDVEGRKSGVSDGAQETDTVGVPVQRCIELR
ncbi:neuronal acetylcholine receptor subunit alpha-7-like isoform X3 [Anolis sagrei]|uniref:neuronal acetylcholine receptor subunit alpha-7-like isoform X3 n=1 Tax=Anolis sagrei TaxID=38937 RepID=UPI003522AB7F